MTFGINGSYAQVSVAKDLNQKELEDIVKELGCNTQEEILWWLADLGPNDFIDEKDAVTLRRVLSYDLDLTGRLFHYKPGQYGRPAIHHAINKKNVAFLNCLLSLGEANNGFPLKTLPNVNAEVVAALRVMDDTSASHTCLHSAVLQRLACVPKMVQLYASVQGTHTGLLLDAMDREAERRNRQKADRDQPLQSIFSMPDAKGNTVLHLLMDSIGRPQLTAARGRMGRRQQDGVGKSSTKGMEYDPMTVIEVIEGVCKPVMGQLWTAVNKAGMSPYKALVENRRGNRSTVQNDKDPGLGQQQIFQDKIKAKIFSSLSEIPDLKMALYGTRANSLGLPSPTDNLEKELCLDMSDFNRSSHDFKRFVTELTTSEDRNTVHFEEYLVSVFLPDLNTFKKPVPHDGVDDLFGWLKSTAKVKRIKSLNIPDNTSVPMSDGHVSEYILKRFEIEKFVWRKLDINLDILVSSPNGKVFTDITLFSTGNFSVLYHWVSKDGIGSLPDLRNVTIEIMALNTLNQPAGAQTRHSQVVEQYRAKLEAMLKDRKKEKEDAGKKAGDSKFIFTYKINTNGRWDFPTPQFMPHQPDEIEQLELIQKLQACHTFLTDMDAKKTNAAYIERFERLRNREIKEGDDNSHLIKVAIIDNGADKFRQRIRECIERGVSYVKADTDSTDRILPWWMVSDPHGTQMASLVSAVNPWCRLYIARVGKGRRDILPGDAVKAVKWAVEQKVDIISISWVTKSMVPELRAVIESAAKHTLVFCSTADTGTWSGPAFPADYNDTVRVSATDKYGNLMPASDKGSHAVNVPVPGEDIPAFGPSYMGEGIAVGTVSGSSVATALAAGIASLALMMLIVFNGKDKEALKQDSWYSNKKMGSLLSVAINQTALSDPLIPVASKIKELPERWKLASIMARPEMKTT
ncbi:hypothetical protein DL764_002792 [Monosporascus ibericus]|uniref:Peptidase S8/S53 domain-containing protein n=1 Tax=Monosporascus ibericus TaxID=155417 RepID=A0A4Q4TNV8_9PEZI|nr:hypothetical protein DL764_002792 [Monosporascus ibericus]